MSARDHHGRDANNYPYRCAIDGRRFKTPKALRVHKRTSILHDRLIRGPFYTLKDLPRSKSKATRVIRKLLGKGWDRVLQTDGYVIAIQPGLHWSNKNGTQHGYTPGHILIVPLKETLTVGAYEGKVKHPWEVLES